MLWLACVVVARKPTFFNKDPSYLDPKEPIFFRAPYCDFFIGVLKKGRLFGVKVWPKRRYKARVSMEGTVVWGRRNSGLGLWALI